MRRFEYTLAAFLFIVPALQAQPPESPQPVAEHAAVIAELQNEPAAVRSFQLNERREIIAISLCGHLSPEDILAVNKLTTLQTLTIGGDLPYSRLNPPTKLELAAEKRRHELFPLAMPQLGELTSITNLKLRHVPSAEEMQVIFGWKQLESLAGEIPPEHYPGISKLTKLQRLTLTGKHGQPLSPQFLAPLAALESLSLPPGFRDDTFTYLADKKRLTKIEGAGLSGESLVDYLMEKRGRSFLHALRGAGYWVTADEFGKITKLHFAYTTTFDRLYSARILDRLTDLREIAFTHITDRDDEILQAVRGRPLESLTLTNASLRPEMITEFCKLKSLKHLSVAFSAKEIELPAISGLPMLESLSLGGINDYKTNITEIRNLPRLVELRIFGSDIDREQVEQFQRLPSLKHLNLAGGTVSHAAVEGIASISQLQSIDLSRTDIGDEQLALLRALMHLESLKTQGTDVSVDARARFLREHLGKGPVRILEDAGARCRREDGNQITHVSIGKRCGSELIRSVAELPAVSKLKFVMTRLDKDALVPLGLLSSVNEVEFIYCKTLDDDMIAQLVAMPALRKLTISNSGLSDDSKDALLKLTNLERFEIRGKSISPSMVAEIRAKLPNVDIID